jgi:RNA polymerase sigma-70 factor (ECF subfamily)
MHHQPASAAAAAARSGGAGMNLADEEVVVRVRGGETDLFEILMRRHNQLLYRTVRSILRDESETEDALQDAYVQAFTHLDQFLGRARFSTWLTRIAVHEALRRRRRRQRTTTVETAVDGLASPLRGPESRMSDRELRVILEASVDRLSDQFRTVFVLRDVQGMTTAETAESLGIPEETVKTRLHRARRQLRGHLELALHGQVREVFPFGFTRCDRLVDAVMQRIGHLMEVTASG